MVRGVQDVLNFSYHSTYYTSIVTITPGTIVVDIAIALVGVVQVQIVSGSEGNRREYDEIRCF